MAPQSVSREGSVNSTRNHLRRGSASTSNTNVFGDEFALDSQGSMGDMSPVDSIQNSVDFPHGAPEHNTSEPTRNFPRSVHSTPPTTLEAPYSPSTYPLPTDLASIAPNPRLSTVQFDTRTTRSLSTSSRLSMPRPHSPYSGPTAPSQPYAMYPQVTRASSIASGSTVRPAERPFVPQGGPEHPYAMYQNTVPEEDDEPSPNVPLGFPGGNRSFQESRSSGDDTGDIVGTDGHVETLPPYTRYADNVVAKGDMAEFNRSRTAVSESDATPTDPPTNRSVTQLTPAGIEAVEDAEARKEGWKTRAKRRRCCGVPCWIFLLVVIVVFIATALGGIIGGVIGNKQGVERAEAASSATTTVWLDADAVSTGTSLPPCPTGHYTMMLNQTQQVEQCIVDTGIQAAGSWDCMDVAALGVSVFDEGAGFPPKVVFDDYSLRPQLFRYGPQPPDFNQTTFELTPVKDKEDDEYGVAMFFSSLFDKIVILEEDQISTDMVEKRSVAMSQMQQRRYTQEFRYLAVGDNPWYCFWNSTVEEFWIFLEKEWDGSAASTTSSAAVSMMTTGPAYGPNNPWAPQSSSYMPAAATAAATSAVDSDTDEAMPTSAPTSWDGPKPRGFPDAGEGARFPKMVKMVEKRKPHSNVQPYCQQMEVKPNWKILPIPDIPTLCIEEAEYSIPEPTGDSKRWLNRYRRRGDDYTQQLESMCICEWMSGE